MTFKPTSDPCLYVKHTAKGINIVTIYVDDILVGGVDNEVIADVKSPLISHLDIEDLGLCNQILGLK